MNEQKLVFIYNADSDLFSTVTDFAHKVLSPSTYQCQLCALTYGNFSMKEEWNSFINGLPLEAVFLHKNEYEKQYKSHTSLPAVFIITKDTATEIIDKEEIESCQSLEQLKSLVMQKVHNHVQRHHSNL